MPRIAFITEFDGTDFAGFQSQENARAVQDVIEKALEELYKTKIRLTGCSRTDAGVHALGQAASFHMDTDKTPEEIMAYMNAYLPEDISVISCEEKPERFHARLNAKGKVYRYCIWNSDKKPVFRRKYVHQVPGGLDMAAMKQAAAFLVGTHDYQSFTSTKRGKKSTVRTVDSIEIERSGEELIFTFKGNGFLYHMVRIMMGTLIETGLGIRKAEEIPRILEAKDRSKSGHLIPGKGLTLMEVIYDN